MPAGPQSPPAQPINARGGARRRPDADEKAGQASTCRERRDEEQLLSIWLRRRPRVAAHQRDQGAARRHAGPGLRMYTRRHARSVVGGRWRFALAEISSSWGFDAGASGREGAEGICRNAERETLRDQLRRVLAPPRPPQEERQVPSAMARTGPR